MKRPPNPEHELARLAALRSLRVLNSDAEEAAFDAVARSAALTFDVPLAGISLIDDTREWFKASVGQIACEGDRDNAFCAHTILTDEPLVIEDARLDERFNNNPKVTDEGVRFYAGAPIVLSTGERVGAVCIRDTRPRTLDRTQREILRQMARTVAGMLEYRRDSLLRSNAEHNQEQLGMLIDEGAIYSVTDPDGTIIHVNDMFCSVSGYSRDELIGSNHRIVNSGVHPDTFWRNMYRTVRRGETWKGVIQNRTKGGEPYWVQSVIQGVYDQSGELKQMHAIRFDITDLRQAVRRLRMTQQVAVENAKRAERTESLLNRVGQLSLTGGWEFDIESNTLTWTEETYRIHEVEPGTPIDVDAALNYYHPERRQELADSVQRGIEHGEPWDLELPFTTARGRSLVVRTQGEAEREDGRVTRLFGSFQDITAQKQAVAELEQAREAAEAASEAKSGFLANMSHELRTPLTAILGFSEILGDDTTDAEGVSYAAGIISSNAKHLLTLINDILDLSKIESERIELCRVECSPRQLARDLDSMMRSVAEAKGIAYETEIEYSIARMVLIDEVRVRQILVNLVGNAVKFTNEGRVRVTLSCRPDEQDRVSLVVRVRDTGIGIDEACVDRIFRPFMQGEASSTRHFGGTGLGLSISKRLAERMGGRIEVESTLGRGSCFTLVKPLSNASVELIEEADDQVIESEPEPALVAGELLGSRILLVEDGEDNQRLLELLLTWAGAEVEIAGDGREGADAALAAMVGDTPFDLVLMDMQMPVLDGFDATRELRAAGFGTPVIALTAYTTAEDRARCLDAGCDEFLTKPIARHNLIERCKVWISGDAGRGAKAA